MSRENEIFIAVKVPDGYEICDPIIKLRSKTDRLDMDTVEGRILDPQPGDAVATVRDRASGIFSGNPEMELLIISAAKDTLKFGDKLFAATQPAAPIDMILYCPNCGLQHVDEVESVLVWTGGAVPEPSHDEITWENPPHRSHLCHECGCIWRPADVATNGVAEIKTKGKADTWNIGIKEISAKSAQPPADTKGGEQVELPIDSNGGHCD